jgi:NIMA (never in mitosis gene a)-related kinase
MLLKIFRNENIISYKESFLEDSSQTFNIIMEFADGGDLLSKITKCKQSGIIIPEYECWSYFI